MEEMVFHQLGFQRGCETVTLDGFICRLWLNTVICSRFLIYYGVTGDMLAIKNSAFSKAIQFSKYETGERTFIQTLPILKPFVVC